MTPLPDVVFSALPNLNKKATLALLEIYRHKLISEAELLNNIRLRPGDTAPVMESISKYITIYSNTSREVHYAVNLTLLLADYDCPSCKYSAKKVLRHDGSAIKYYECSLPVSCACDYSRIAEATVKIHKLMKKMKVVESVGHKIVRKAVKTVRDYVDLDITEWRNTEYVDFIYDKYKEYYPHLSTLNKKTISLKFQILKKAFVAEYEEEEWPLLLKHYITWAFEEAARLNKVVSMKYMCGHRNMVEFVSNSTYVKQLAHCKQYDIMCPYMKKTCIIISGGSECTSKLRDHMNKRYN